MSQMPVYSLNQPQVDQLPGNPSVLEPPLSMRPAKRFLKEGKVLGAIQMMIGLIHIGLGIIMGTIMPGPYTIVSFYGGYPFWGGILFIISGSLSVATEQLPRSPCLLKGCTGLNITSAICSMVGIMLLISDMIINSLSKYNDPSHYIAAAVGVATSAVLFVFSLLEFCIACTIAHFGCKLICSSQNNGAMVFQTVYVTHPVANPEPVNTPPSYSSEEQDSK